MSAKSFKAMVLDEGDVFVDLVELASEAALTDRHVDLRPHGGDCDRPFGQYRWDRERQTLVPLAALARPMPGGAVSTERAFDRLLELLERKHGLKLDDVLQAWRGGYRASVDHGGKK